MRLVDTHQHLWDLARFPYSWCAAIPPLNRTFDLDNYVAAAAGLGITKTVFMEADVDDPHPLGEAQWVHALADQHPLIQGIIASGRPEHEGFRQHLEQLARLPKVRGLRRVLHVQPDELSRQPRFVENLRQLPDFGFTFDLCVLARQLPLARALVRQLPEVTFVLDHCGVPDIKGGVLDPWREHVTALADAPNVHCKVSGLVAYTAPSGWTVDDLRPWFEHVVDAFGWDRLVWGGDWPVCTLAAPLSRWVAASRALTAQATEDQRSRFFHANAERLYHL